RPVKHFDFHGATRSVLDQYQLRAGWHGAAGTLADDLHDRQSASGGSSFPELDGAARPAASQENSAQRQLSAAAGRTWLRLSQSVWRRLLSAAWDRVDLSSDKSPPRRL